MISEYTKSTYLYKKRTNIKNYTYSEKNDGQVTKQKYHTRKTQQHKFLKISL